jgi:hypothetical protein
MRHSLLGSKNAKVLFEQRTLRRYRRRLGPYVLEAEYDVRWRAVLTDRRLPPAPKPVTPDPDAERRKFLEERDLQLKRVRDTEVLDISRVLAKLQAAIKDTPARPDEPLDPAAVLAKITAEIGEISGLFAKALDELRATPAGAVAALDGSGLLPKIMAEIGGSSGAFAAKVVDQLRTMAAGAAEAPITSALLAKFIAEMR